MVMVLRLISKDGCEWVRVFEALNREMDIEYLY